MADFLAEWEHGKGAFKALTKLVLCGRDSVGGLAKMTFGGVFLSEEMQIDHDDWEMWECEIIIIPKRKYKNDPEKSMYGGMRIDQILTSQYAHPETWGDEYFEQTT